MCGIQKYFSTIPHSTYDPPKELQWHWTYLDLSVVQRSRYKRVPRFEFSLLCSWCEQESIVAIVEKVLWAHCRDRAALFRCSSVEVIPARTKRLSIGVGRRHPVTNRKALCMADFDRSKQPLYSRSTNIF